MGKNEGETSTKAKGLLRGKKGEGNYQGEANLKESTDAGPDKRGQDPRK